MTTAQPELAIAFDSLPEPRTAAELGGEPETPKPARTPLPIPPEATPTKVRVPRAEPLTPFMAWSAEVRSSRQVVSRAGRELTLIDGFLHAPDVIVDRLLVPNRVPGLVLAAATVTAVCTAAYEATVVLGFDLPSPRPIVLAPLMVLLAEAAAVGPIYAASILAAARIPVARLGAAILAASATGALLLAALAPALDVIVGFDREWLGPLSMVGAFFLSALVSGRRLYRLLLGTAERLYQRDAGPTARLSPADAERAALVARVACMTVGFTLALACWTSSAL